MPSDQKIDYLELPGSDFAAIKKFYVDTFGWKFTDYGPDYTAFTDDHLNGGFYRSELHSSTANGAALVVLFAADLEATRDRVVTGGGTICREIFTFPGGRRFHFQDPHGNELAIWAEV